MAPTDLEARARAALAAARRIEGTHPGPTGRAAARRARLLASRLRVRRMRLVLKNTY